MEEEREEVENGGDGKAQEGSVEVEIHGRQGPGGRKGEGDGS